VDGLAALGLVAEEAAAGDESSLSASEISSTVSPPSREKSPEDQPFLGQHILTVGMFTDKEMVKVVLKRAEKFHKAMTTPHANDPEYGDLLKVVVFCLFEVFFFFWLKYWLKFLKFYLIKFLKFYLRNFIGRKFEPNFIIKIKKNNFCPLLLRFIANFALEN
jgi:hypothetical protein